LQGQHSTVEPPLNLVAAVLVLIPLTKEFNLSSAVIQITWIGISIVGLVRMALLARRTKLSSEESAFVSRIFQACRGKAPEVSSTEGAGRPSRKTAASDGDLQAIIHLALDVGTREKLAAANRRLAELTGGRRCAAKHQSILRQYSSSRCARIS
jgi:hypothetical protein